MLAKMSTPTYPSTHQTNQKRQVSSQATNQKRSIIAHPSSAANSPQTHTETKNGAASLLSPAPALLSSAAAAAAMTGHRPLSIALAKDGFTPRGYVSPAPTFRFAARGHRPDASPCRGGYRISDIGYRISDIVRRWTLDGHRL